jgi:hypothetical protein
MKDEYLCFCVDYRKLNDVTKHYVPHPKIDETVDTLAGTTLDLKRGFLKRPCTPTTKRIQSYPA